MKAGADYGKASNKSIYLFSVDRNAGKVAHVNFVPQELVKSKKLDAKIWLEEANKVLGGKVNCSPERERSMVMIETKAILFCRVEASPIPPWDPATTSTRYKRPSSRYWPFTSLRSRVPRMLG